MRIKNKVKPAKDFKPDQVFADQDNDLFVRCEDGCIALHIEHNKTLFDNYTEAELSNYVLFPYLKECRKVVTTVKIEIT